MIEKKVCPVCKSAGEDPKTAKCIKCGFENAFIDYFASKNSYNSWLKEVETAKAAIKKQKIAAVNSDSFFIGSDMIAYCDADSSKIYVIGSTGIMNVYENAKQISVCMSGGYAVLYNDGTVKVFCNNNDYKQKDTADWRNIENVLFTPKCTYGVKSDGRVCYAGLMADNDIYGWKNIKSLVYGSTILDESFIVGLTDTKNVLVSKISSDISDTQIIGSWEKIKKIVASRNCVAGLCEDGTVMFFGKDDDPRQDAAKWRNVLDVTADNSFIYGLSETKKILVSGKTKSFLDKGRSSVSWEDIVAISSNNSGICAINGSGDLNFAGTLSGDFERIRKLWNSDIKPLIS